MPLPLVWGEEDHAFAKDFPYIGNDIIVIGIYLSPSKHTAYLPLLQAVQQRDMPVQIRRNRREISSVNCLTKIYKILHLAYRTTRVVSHIWEWNLSQVAGFQPHLAALQSQREQ